MCLVSEVFSIVDHWLKIWLFTYINKYFWQDNIDSQDAVIVDICIADIDVFKSVVCEHLEVLSPVRLLLLSVIWFCYRACHPSQT